MEVNGVLKETTILHLPDEVLEFILSLVSPYDDLENCRCVCKKWEEHSNVVARRLEQRFRRCIVEMDVTWTVQCPLPGPSIMARYSHCACRYNNSMFVFGGCTLMETAFNDLWRFDLSTRRWVRPLAVGTYPPPSASSTIVVHKDTLIVFGGWACSSPSLLYQGRRCFNLLHFYSPESNRWDRITTPTSPPPMAKHTTTVHKDLMVVFGGVQLESSDRDPSVHCLGYNDVWVLDVARRSWFLQDTTDPKPEPRFGHTQVRVDDDHALVIGGCGGPNRMFRDVWLLTIERLSRKPWTWTKMCVRGSEFSPPNMWNHQGCKVGHSVVFLSCGKRGEPYAKYALYSLFRAVPRAWRPVQQNRSAPRASPENCVNGRKGTFAKRGSSSSKPRVVVVVGGGAVRRSSSSSGGSNNEEEEEIKDSVVPPQPPTRAAVKPRGAPSIIIRPNSSRNNWQQHLDGLRRMEDRIRSLRSAVSLKAPVLAMNPAARSAEGPLGTEGSMQMYTLDIGSVVRERVVTWLSVQPYYGCGPEETIFFSLVEGKGELILFGGVQNRNVLDEAFEERGVDDDGHQGGGGGGAEGRAAISNSLAFVSPKKYIV